MCSLYVIIVHYSLLYYFFNMLIVYYIVYMALCFVCVSIHYIVFYFWSMFSYYIYCGVFY